MSKVWFITGSSRGLGKSLVRFALEKGDCVVATARNPSAVDDLVQKYGTEKLLVLALDVSNYEAAQVAAKKAKERFGRVDLVVNNAGYADMDAIEDVDIASFEKQINANFFGVVYVTKAFLPILREQGSGHFFQVSSVGSRVCRAGLSAYQSAKWAVAGFTSCLAAEIGPLGIKATCVEPGGMRTDWAGDSMQTRKPSQPYEQSVGKSIEMTREYHGKQPIDPEKVGAVLEKIYKSPEPPVRLLIGSDAVHYAALAADDLANSDEKWKEISTSAEF